ncbi:polysaccharide deacetylase family protein [Arcobacter sp. FWKO B]|nr:polysaccharide deacetylase family protein [Arcobacter sp. FWKO B]
MYVYSIADATIFVYHRFGDDRHPSTNTSLEQLRKDFEFLKNNNYHVVPLSAVVDKIKKNEDIPDKWVVLTIDDAYKSFYENGLAIFKEYGYHFTLFVYVKATDHKYGDFMTWDMLKNVLPYGDVEFHSYNHPRLTTLSKEDIIKDTKIGMEIFQANMGYKPKFYAYPYGSYNQKVKDAIKSFGFEGILNQTSGGTNLKSDVYDLFRVPLVGTSNISAGLRYRVFDVQWIEPLEFPKDGILKKVRAKVPKDVAKVKLFVTGNQWIENIEVKDGIVDVDLNIHLQNSRTRVILGTTYHHISNKILIK